jgi:opacity protein-like surface antigen
MTTRVRASILALAFGAIVTLLPAVAAAQTPVTVGVKGGVNIAKISFDDDEDNEDVKSLVGAVAGLFVGKQFNDTFGLRAEGLFSQKGFKDAESGDDAKFKLTYVDVPLLLTLGPSSSTDTRFNVFTGPQVSFNLKAEEEFAGVTTDRDEDVKSTDFGWVLGAGLEKGRITADARYTLGLSNIAEGGNDVKNKAFSVMIGVKLK